MQLRIARLCLDCEEIHDAQTCPVCSSESFSYISRWVPAPERRQKPRPAPASPQAETYRQLLAPTKGRSTTVRWVAGGALGLAAVSVAQWVWRGARGAALRDGAEPDAAHTEGPEASPTYRSVSDKRM